MDTVTQGSSNFTSGVSTAAETFKGREFKKSIYKKFDSGHLDRDPSGIEALI